MSIDKFIISVLIISNYSTWATQIEHILYIHNVWEVVSGIEKESKENDSKYNSTAIVNYNWKQVDQYPHSYFAAVTYFTAILQTKFSNIWLYNSIYDVHITCFKKCFLNYHEFPKSKSIIDFDEMEVQT